MSAHTPGPWRVSEQCAQMIDIRHAGGDVPGAISLTLAKVVARPTWQTEAEANARLIAAAPDLLSAAREAADLLSAVEGCSRNNFEQLAYEVEGQLRAAIAKATGEAP